MFDKKNCPSKKLIFCKHYNHTILNNSCDRIFSNNVSFKIYKDIFAFSRKATGAPSCGEFKQWCPVAWAKEDYDKDDDDDNDDCGDCDYDEDDE